MNSQIQNANDCESGKSFFFLLRLRGEILWAEHNDREKTEVRLEQKF